jgi:hypothetical protein
MHSARRRWIKTAGGDGRPTQTLSGVLRLAAVIVAGSIGGHALAQPAVGGGLPCSIASAERVDSAAEEQIREFVRKHIELLKSDSPHTCSRAREALMEPLACQPVSVSFRLKYSEIAEPALTPLVAGSDDRIAINALRVSARLRTTSSLRTIEAGLGSKSAPVRFGASSAARDLFSQLAVDSFGFPENSVDRLMDRLASSLTTESDAIVGDGLALALCEGPKAAAALRTKGAARLNPALAERIKTLRGDAKSSAVWVDVAYRALDSSRLTMMEQVAAGGADKAVAVSAALLGGQALAMARDRMATTSEADRPALVRLVNAAEITMVWAHNSATGQKVGEKALQKAFESAASTGKVSEFSDAIESWIGPAGLLTKAPYSASAADFAARP